MCAVNIFCKSLSSSSLSGLLQLELLVAKLCSVVCKKGLATVQKNWQYFPTQNDKKPMEPFS